MIEKAVGWGWANRLHGETEGLHWWRVKYENNNSHASSGGVERKKGDIERKRLKNIFSGQTHVCNVARALVSGMEGKTMSLAGLE